MEHPIEGLMNTVMKNLKEMVDVKTVVGEPIESVNGTVIIPVSKIAFGFSAAGTEFKGTTVDQYSKEGTDEDITYKLPFGGGSGAGASMTPIGFLVITDSCTKMVPVDHCSALDKLLDYVPDLLEKITDFLNRDYECPCYEFECDEGCECGCQDKKEENNPQ